MSVIFMNSIKCQFILSLFGNNSHSDGLMFTSWTE